MKQPFELVDCKAIEESLKDNLPECIKVIGAWVGCMRKDNTITVYVKITQIDDNFPSYFTEVVIADLKAICGELLDVEIKDARTLEFGFALPLTSHYYND